MTVVHRQDVALLERLGGSDAAVHRAILRTTGRVVVAKHATADRGDVCARLERAASILERVQHPGLVRLVARVDDDGCCLLLAHQPGGSLGELITRGELPTPGDIATLGARVASALASLHDDGVVHRDVHPGNVLLDADLAGVLADLDNALDAAARPLPGDREVVGHPDHVDPRVLGGRAADPSSDLHGLATTLWAAATGRVPPRDGPGGRVALPTHAHVPTALRDVLAACLDGTVTDAATAATTLRSVATDLRRPRPAAELAEPRQHAAAATPPSSDDVPVGQPGAAADDARVGQTQRWGVPPRGAAVEHPPATMAGRRSSATRRPVVAATAGTAVLLAGSLLVSSVGGSAAPVSPPPVCDATSAPPGQQVAADLDGDGCAEFVGLADGLLHTPDARYLVGQSGDVLVAGDWDGDGRWGIGLYRPTTGEVFLIDDPGPGARSRPAALHAAGGEPAVVQGRSGHEVRVGRP